MSITQEIGKYPHLKSEQTILTHFMGIIHLLLAKGIEPHQHRPKQSLLVIFLKQDSSIDKMNTTKIKINSDHLQTIQEDKMFQLAEKEKSLPCIESSQQDNYSKPDEMMNIQ